MLDAGRFHSEVSDISSHGLDNVPGHYRFFHLHTVANLVHRMRYWWALNVLCSKLIDFNRKAV